MILVDCFYITVTGINLKLMFCQMTDQYMTSVQQNISVLTRDVLTVECYNRIHEKRFERYWKWILIVWFHSNSSQLNASYTFAFYFNFFLLNCFSN